MTRNEALKAMATKKLVIYAGAGSMGRTAVMGGGNRKAIRFRGSPQSIGYITDVMRTNAIVQRAKHPTSRFIFSIRDLHVCNEQEARNVP